MTEHTIDLTDEQAQLAADGQLTEIRIPIDACCETPEVVYEHEPSDWFNGIQGGEGWFCVNCGAETPYPYAIGDTINCREAWGEAYTKDLETKQLVHKRYLYKPIEILRPATVFVCGQRADMKPIETMADLYKWQPASTMPDDAIRHRFTVQSVGAEQEGEKWYWVLGVNGSKHEKRSN